MSLTNSPFFIGLFVNYKEELNFAINNGALVLPVVLNNSTNDSIIDLPIKSFSLDMQNFDKDVDKLIDTINNL